MPNKVAEYDISVCRQMGIDPSAGYQSWHVWFSVDNGAIRYALSAIKSIGRGYWGLCGNERNLGNTSLKTFVERNIDQINKRVGESDQGRSTGLSGKETGNRR